METCVDSHARRFETRLAAASDGAFADAACTSPSARGMQSQAPE